MFNKINGYNPFVVSKVESVQKSTLSNHYNDADEFEEQRKKLARQKTFLETLNDLEKKEKSYDGLEEDVSLSKKKK